MKLTLLDKQKEFEFIKFFSLTTNNLGKLVQLPRHLLLDKNVSK